MTTLPPEIVETVIYEAWHSVMPSSMRTSFMTTCPLVNRTWKAVYAPIASRDIYITNRAYIYYLCKIARLQKSIIYYDFIPQLTRTITCYVYLGDQTDEAAVERVYHHLINLPNDAGFKNLFPLVPYLSFELGWVSLGRNPLFPESCDIPIYVRAYWHRYLSTIDEEGKIRLDVGISMTDTDPLRCIHSSTWTDTMWKLRKVRVIGGVPWFLYPRFALYHGTTADGIRNLHRTAKVYQYRGDIKDINRNLWMASKRVRVS
ncbi:uncharacterized protein EV420DRAFT_873451 [Desarmillaria tabescens]|uniref:Uncharacterized protein n=1 Tax=Armillaria tabescens TaxID=1929756 RepID=A0AA39MVJ7_ARMTA|nr:uncharacterized protein EV420DRAFT_873451 [Desarmillaria tabescens]KAK0447410.1 hypothetical protein EV420DRAFT_873451 [Desarmillaria tabescens]